MATFSIQLDRTKDGKNPVVNSVAMRICSGRLGFERHPRAREIPGAVESHPSQ